MKNLPEVSLRFSKSLNTILTKLILAISIDIVPRFCLEPKSLIKPGNLSSLIFHYIYMYVYSYIYILLSKGDFDVLCEDSLQKKIFDAELCCESQGNLTVYSRRFGTESRE